MPFSAETSGSDRVFNNADSFAMAFDETWKTYSPSKNEPNPNQEEKLKIILLKIKDHPFLKQQPEKANEIARFRLRLMNIE